MNFAQLDNNKVAILAIQTQQLLATKIKKKIKSSCLSSITRGVVAQSPEPEAHALSVPAFRVELEF